MREKQPADDGRKRKPTVMTKKGTTIGERVAQEEKSFATATTPTPQSDVASEESSSARDEWKERFYGKPIALARAGDPNSFWLGETLVKIL